MAHQRATPASLASLVDYFCQCLAQERQGEVRLSDREFFGNGRQPARFHPVSEIPSNWDDLLSTPAAQRALRQAQQRTETIVLFAPLLVCLQDRETKQRFWQPAAGVFCSFEAGRLRPDPADVYLGPPFEEIATEDLPPLRATLEQAARSGPCALAQVVHNFLAEGGAAIHPASYLSTIAPPALVALAGFWVVGEPVYDRALTEELQELRKSSSSGTALSFLFAPPAVEAMRTEDILLALTNPARPTLSQAIALAAAMRSPLTVITGPPGTGKTRLIVGLIIHHLLTKQSVLLASRINRAVDAAVELAERLMGQGCILRTGNEQARQELAQVLDALLDRREWVREGELFQRLPSFPQLLPSLETMHAAIQQVAFRLDTLCQRMQGWARKLRPFGLRPAESGWARFWWSLKWFLVGNRRWLQFRTLWDEAEQLLQRWWEESAERWRLVQSVALHARLTELLRKGQPVLRALQQALGGDRQSRLRAFEKAARLGFPIAITTLSVGQNLPMSAGMVDTLIVDEASSCDPASLLPLLYRAKRVVIVGDPKQLDHVTRERWKKVAPVPALRSHSGRSFAASFGTSAFALMSQLIDGHSFWLTDHFRCPPPIIAFSNEAFYGGRLRIHTNWDEPEPIKVQRVSGHHRAVGPTRSLSNEQQLEAALKCLLQWAQQVPEASLGLVAPYRAFVDAVIERLNTDPSLAPLRERWERRQLLIGTAHRFQGSEVDFLVFATVAGDNATQRERNWVEFPNLFNVAITRARRQLVLLLSPQFEQLALLTKQLLRAKVYPVRFGAEDTRPFLQAVTDELKRLGIPFRISGSYYGDSVDLLDDNEPPRWGAVLSGWEELTALTPLALLQLRDRLAALQQRRLPVWLVFPATFDQWLAQLIAMTPPRHFAVERR